MRFRVFESCKDTTHSSTHLKYLANNCYSVTVYWLNNRWLKYWGSVTSISSFASDIIRQFQMIRMIMREQLVSPSSECLCSCWPKKEVETSASKIFFKLWKRGCSWGKSWFEITTIVHPWIRCSAIKGTQKMFLLIVSKLYIS